MQMPFNKILTLILLLLTSSLFSLAVAEIKTYNFLPSDTNPNIKNFNEPHLLVYDPDAANDVPLVVFLTGTSGKPVYSVNFLQFIAGLGYRVIGLEYNDEPAVNQICPSKPDSNCAEAFRKMRLYGEQSASSPVQNSAR